MKNTISIILILFSIYISQAQTKLWKLNLITDNHTEIVSLTKTGKTLKGTLNDGGRINITINLNKISGYFKWNKKMYKLKGTKESSYSGINIFGKYCACSGEPNNSFYLSENNKEATTNMQGTWNTSFGELKLLQNGNRIYGDYKNVGTIKATIKGNLVSGEFTNGSRKGKFRWILEDNSFKGKWAWEGNTLAGEWNGTLKNSSKPILKNSSSNNNTSTSNTNSNPNNKTTGTWSTNLGEFKIKQYGNTIKGEIGNNGHIFGLTIWEKTQSEIGPVYFTKGTKKGEANWTIKDDKLIGTWHWDLDQIEHKLTGKLINPKLPKFTIKKHTNFNGRYRITITNIYANTYNPLDLTLNMYGAIGIRLKGKSNSGLVTISNIGNKKPRVWDVSESNPLPIKIKDKFIVYGDLTGQPIGYNGALEVDKMREFNVSGELANSNLMVNIQTNLAEDRLLGDDKYGWKQRNLYIKDMVLGVEYYIEIKSKQDKNKRIYVGFMIEKI